jgi:hypothetical protein
MVTARVRMIPTIVQRRTRTIGTEVRDKDRDGADGPASLPRYRPTAAIRSWSVKTIGATATPMATDSRVADGQTVEPGQHVALRTTWDGDSWVGNATPFCSLRCALDYARNAYRNSRTHKEQSCPSSQSK